MVGIVAFGAYIPRYRLDRKEMARAISWINPSTLGLVSGEKAVSNWDEDSITLSVASSRNALFNVGLPDGSGLLYSASTSFPYAERINASIIAEALGVAESVSTGDFSSTSRASTIALLSALRSLKSEEISWAIVTSAETKKTKPGSLDEFIQGDGGASVVLGKDRVVAKFIGSYSISFDFPSPLKGSYKNFSRFWEDRWTRDEGFFKLIPEAIVTYLRSKNLVPEDFAFLIYGSPYPREHGVIGRRAGFSEGRVVDPLFLRVGDTSSAHPLLLLCDVLERAKPGDQILVVGWGGGVDVIHFEVTEHIFSFKPKWSFETLLGRKASISYEKFLTFREILEAETGLRGEFQSESPLSVMWRHRKTILGLVGSRCKKCNTPQFPPQRVCAIQECQAIDEMEPYGFSDKEAVIFSYTGDNLAFSYDPPQIYGIIDFKEGGRMMLDFTDTTLSELRVGMKVELSFRKKYHDKHRGIHTYFWKAMPAFNSKEA